MSKKWVFGILLLLLVNLGAQAKTCPAHAVYGLIGQRYQKLQGSDGPLGCPTTDEANTPDGKGRFNDFEHGEIVYSPKQGPKTVISAYLSTDQLHVVIEWGDMSPFHYDRFNLKPSFHFTGSQFFGKPLEGQYVVNDSGSSGSYSLTAYQGDYYISIEGCDTHHPADSTCHQGWTEPVHVNVPGPSGSPSRVPQGPGVGGGPTSPNIVWKSNTGTGASTVFTIVGSSFSPNSQIIIKVTEDSATSGIEIPVTVPPNGIFTLTHSVPCNRGHAEFFTALEGTKTLATIRNGISCP